MAAGESIVGSILGYLRLDADQFNREIDKAIGKAEALEHMDPDVRVQVHATGANAELDKVATKAALAGKNISGMGGSFGRIPGGAPVLIAGVATAIALIGPVAGAATAGLAGVTGALGVGILAWKGYQHEIEKGTALGTNLNGRLDETKGLLSGLAATSARAMAPGLLTGLATLNGYLPTMDGNVESLGKHLGNALAISSKGLVSGLRTAMPLLEDGGRYAEILAQKFADFAQSQDFKDFIAYARRELPVVVSGIWSLTKGVIDLAVALAPIGDAAVRSIGALGHALSVIAPVIKEITSHGGGEPLLLDRNGKAIKNIDDYRYSVEGAAKAVGDQTVAVAAMNPHLLAQANAMGTTTTALVAAEDAQRQTASATAAATLKMQLENDAAGILKQSLDLLNGEALTAADAQNAFDSSLVNMGTHTTTTGKQIKFTTSNIHNMSAASVALRGQLNGQVANLQRVVEANGGLSDSTGQAKAQMVKMRKQIIDNAVAHGVDRKAVTEYIDEILKVPDSVPPTKLEVEKTAAERKVRAFQKLIDNLHGKNVAVSVSVLTGTLNKLRNIPGVTSANGNILNAYAGGGFENHTAQIAPAGAMRLWAEPETGGEAYIPLAPSKRARSMAIWEETGRRLGVEGGGSGAVALDAATIQALAAAMSRVQLATVVSAGSVDRALVGGMR